MIDRIHELPVSKQIKLVGISRSSAYYEAQPVGEADLKLMRRIDELHLEFPFAGARILVRLLRREDIRVERRHVGTLMRRMGITALYCKPNTSRRHPKHKIWPYLLRNMTIDRANQVWALDTTYIPMAHGFVYLTAVLDWASHKVLSYRVSSVTDAVSEDVKVWQARPLDVLYPILYLDCIHVKVRDTGAVRNKAVYLAIGVNMGGHKEVLGLWIAQTEGTKFWLQVVTELKNRGVQDIFIACVDGLKGFPDAIEAVYPKAAVQLCIVHMVCNSLNFVPWKVRKEVATDLKRVYSGATVDEAELMLTEFEAKWAKDYQSIGLSWRRNWTRITPFFDYRQKSARLFTPPTPLNLLI